MMTNEKRLIDLNNYLDDYIREVHEDDNEFVFRKINKFIGQITEIKISKEELVQAIALVRMKKKASLKYDTTISDDWTTATEQMKALERAYNKGLSDGMQKIKDAVAVFKFKEDSLL